MDNHEKVFLPRNCLPNDVLKEICHFGIKNSIPSTDRSGRDEMCIAKIKYIHVHKHTLDFEDQKNTEFTEITFFRYKPFYITPPSERLKKSHAFVLNAKRSIYFYME